MYVVNYSFVGRDSLPGVQTGTSYLLESGAISKINGVISTRARWENATRSTPCGIGTRTSSLFEMGFGDLIMLTPLLSEMRRRWPTIRITVCCGAEYSDALKYNPDIVNLVSYPIAFTDLSTYEAALKFEETPVFRQHEIPVGVCAHSVMIRRICGTLSK
jgi:hypothetical protein